MRTVLYRIHLLIDNLKIVDSVFISKIKSGEESRIAERQRKGVRDRVRLKMKDSVGNKNDH